MKTSRRWLLAVLAVVPVPTLLGMGLARSETQATPQAKATDRIVAAAPGWVDVQGGTRHLSLKADGVVVAVTQTKGAPVAAGTVLLRLDDEELQLEQQTNMLDTLRQQQATQALLAQLSSAKQETSRLRPLVDIHAEPTDVLRQAEAQVKNLEAAVKAAQLAASSVRVQKQRLSLQREHLLLRAPSRGRVLRLDVNEGEAVSRNTPVLWFAPEAPLIVRAELDERLFAAVLPGMRAEVEAEAGGGPVYAAKVLSVARSVGPVRALPEVHPAAQDDRVVECILELGAAPLLIGQRVLVRIRALP